MQRVNLILENGQAFSGNCLHYRDEVLCELVFIACGIGYSEALTDPTFAGQGVVFTAPLIGNYGVSNALWENESVRLSLMIAQEVARLPSNFQSDGALADKLTNVPVLTDIDTRILVKLLRDNGPMKALLTDQGYAAPPLERIKAFENKASALTVTRPVQVTAGSGKRVVLLDLGARAALTDELIAAGCQVTRLPADSSAETILAQAPQGLVLSNGPGDPRECTIVIETVKALLGKLPIWGIALGHEILALAVGAQVKKLPYGHRGNSIPVQSTATKRITATAQNHAYCVDEATLPADALVTARNLNDGMVEAIDYPQRKAWGVEFIPSGLPEPLKQYTVYDQFVSRMGDAADA